MKRIGSHRLPSDWDRLAVTLRVVGLVLWVVAVVAAVIGIVADRPGVIYLAVIPLAGFLATHVMHRAAARKAAQR